MGRIRIAVYLRVSKVDDYRQMDVSNSIVNQKDMIDKLRDRAKEQGRSLNYVINELIKKGIQNQD